MGEFLNVGVGIMILLMALPMYVVAPDLARVSCRVLGLGDDCSAALTRAWRWIGGVQAVFGAVCLLGGLLRGAPQ